jgi:hypothetical protein
MIQQLLQDRFDLGMISAQGEDAPAGEQIEIFVSLGVPEIAPSPRTYPCRSRFILGQENDPELPKIANYLRLCKTPTAAGACFPAGRRIFPGPSRRISR